MDSNTRDLKFLSVNFTTAEFEENNANVKTMICEMNKQVTSFIRVKKSN